MQQSITLWLSCPHLTVTTLSKLKPSRPGFMQVPSLAFSLTVSTRVRVCLILPPQATSQVQLLWYPMEAVNWYVFLSHSLSAAISPTQSHTIMA
jgi:hypothetical protein